MKFDDLLKNFKDIKQSYAVMNRMEGYKQWTVNEYAQALVGDVGDLQKHLLARRGFQFAPTGVDDKLARELADCLWALLAISDELDIDLENEFTKLMQRLRGKMSTRVVKPKSGKVN